MGNYEYQKAWRDRNPARVNQYTRRYLAKHPGLAAKWGKAWRLKNVEKLRLLRRKYKLWDRYGITPEQYAELARAQGGTCAICARLPKNGHPLVVDHDHVTNTVRGLLCHNCNLTLGKFEDKPEWLERAAGYLRATSKTLSLLGVPLRKE